MGECMWIVRDFAAAERYIWHALVLECDHVLTRLTLEVLLDNIHRDAAVQNGYSTFLREGRHLLRDAACAVDWLRSSGEVE